MQSHFKERIHAYIKNGLTDISRLSREQKYRLTALYLKEASRSEQWEAMTEPQDCEALPELLIEVIEKYKDDSTQGRYVRDMLARTMTNAAVSWCCTSIEDAFFEAHADRMHWDDPDDYSDY